MITGFIILFPRHSVVGKWFDCGSMVGLSRSFNLLILSGVCPHTTAEKSIITVNCHCGREFVIVKWNGGRLERRMEKWTERGLNKVLISHLFFGWLI